MHALLEALMRPRRSWAVALVTLVLGLLLIGLLGEAEREPSPTDSLPDGYQSTEVMEL